MEDKEQGKGDATLEKNLFFCLLRDWGEGVSSFSFSDFFSVWLSYSSYPVHPWQQGRLF